MDIKSKVADVKTKTSATATKVKEKTKETAKVVKEKACKNKPLTAIICFVLVFAIIFTTTVSVFLGNTKGEKIDCKQAVETYNASKPDFSYLFEGVSRNDVSKQLDKLEKQLVEFVEEFNIEKMLYNDATATLLTKLFANVIGAEFNSINFKALKKKFPVAYDYVVSQQEAGKTWSDIEEIPFEIEVGNKKQFVKACGAGAAHLGDAMVKVMLAAPSVYNDALVPAFESLHTGKMPGLFGFVMKTGLSGSKRVEYLINKALSIVEPIKEEPLTYLTSIAPDFIISYDKACAFINDNPAISEDIGLKLPSIELILGYALTALDLQGAPLNKELLKKTGTAKISKSGANGGKRVAIYGDREVIYGLIGDYIIDVVVFNNNFAIVKKMLLEEIKSVKVKDSKFGSYLTSQKTNDMLGTMLDALNKTKTAKQEDVAAQVDAYNAEAKDYSELFKWPATEKAVEIALNAADININHCVSNGNFRGAIYNDAIATLVTKLTAKLCTRELSDISFDALKESFPEAYRFIQKAKEEGKTWADIEMIPFGITLGDRESFVKACGAGGEAFGDAMALAVMVCPNAYDEVLVPVFEALHTGPMVDFESFIASSGLDGAKRMEDVTNKVLTIIEPLLALPLKYLFEMLPDFVASYEKASNYVKNDPYISEKSGIVLPPIAELLSDLLSGFGITLPEYDFSALAKMGTATIEASGDTCGQRMEIKGNKEVVFMSLSSYIVEVLKYEGNLKAIFTFLTDSLELSTADATALVGTLTSLDSVAAEAPAA